MKILNKIAEGSIFIALSIVLSLVFNYFPLFKMPNGGHISLSMLPLILYAFRNGVVYGLIAGLVYGLLNFVVDGASYGALSLLLDYAVAFTVLGLAGLFKKIAEKDSALSYIISIIVIVLVASLRFGAHTLSGVVAFGSGLRESAVYNLGYMVASTLLTIVFFILLKDFLITKKHKQV